MSADPPDLEHAHKTTTLLSDGRELIYFDEPANHTDRTQIVDRRVLPTSHPSSTLRLDRILDEWVAIAGHRQTRTYLPPDSECPLCPSSAAYASEIPATDYDVVVFENRFPSFSLGAWVSEEVEHSWGRRRRSVRDRTRIRSLRSRVLHLRP